jgi:DNA-binding NtrC family response regulator
VILENTLVAKKSYLLIVDDEQVNTDLYEIILEDLQSDLEIKVFNKFAEAEEFIRLNLSKIAIALLDGLLDGRHYGYELAKLIKDAGSKMNIILLTGTPELSIPTGKEHLFDIVLTKPFGSAKLIQCIQESVSKIVV